MGFFHERLKNVEEHKAESFAEGKAETANAVAVKLRARGMSERDIAEIVDGTTEGDVAFNGSVRNGSHGLVPDYDLVARVAAVAAVEAVNLMRSSEGKPEDDGKAEKPES